MALDMQDQSLSSESNAPANDSLTPFGSSSTLRDQGYTDDFQ